jgi:hypothetical protein
MEPAESLKKKVVTTGIRDRKRSAASELLTLIEGSRMRQSVLVQQLVTAHDRWLRVIYYD